MSFSVWTETYKLTIRLAGSYKLTIRSRPGKLSQAYMGLYCPLKYAKTSFLKHYC